MPDVLYREQGPVAVITLNRPEQLNAFQQSMRFEFRAAMQRADGADSVRAIVIHGAGRGFSAGADLSGEMPGRDGAIRQLEDEYLPGIRAITATPKPVIAAVHGFATGIALGYALACDLVVIGDESFMHVPFSSIGLVPDGGVSWQLVQRVGHRIAFELAIDAERIPSARCVALGLANRAVPESRVLDEAIAWGERLSAKAPLAVAGTKLLLHAAAASTLDEAMGLETDVQADCIASTDFLEGVTAFKARRAPRFTGG